MISMTENGDPYENAIAERVNGILKTQLISNQYRDADTASKHIARIQYGFGIFLKERRQES